MKNKYIYIFIVVLLIWSISVTYFLFNWNKKYVLNDTLNWSWIIYSWSEIKNNLLSLNDVLDKKESLSFNFAKVKWNFNLANILIDKFKEVNTINEFNDFENKFGNQNILFIFSKIWDKQGFLKYFSFFIDKNNIVLETKMSKEETLKKAEIIINSIKNKWFFDGNYIDSKWQYDDILISYSSYSMDKKRSLCKKGFSIKWEYNNCIKFVNIMASTKENKYCNNLSYDSYSKKICNDTLKLIK